MRVAQKFCLIQYSCNNCKEILKKHCKDLEGFHTQNTSQVSLNSCSILKKSKLGIYGCDLYKKNNEATQSANPYPRQALGIHQKIGEGMDIYIF